MRRPEITPRTIDEIECVVPVLLAIAFAHLLDARNVSWAAFSGYMVMRGHVSETFPRGVLRMGDVAAEAGHVMSGAAKPRQDRRADETVRAENQDRHA